MIRNVFPAPTGSSSSSTAPAVPNDALRNYAKQQFGLITDPVAKLEAFKVVLESSNATPEIAREFYNLLNDTTKNEFRRHIWLANNRSDEGQSVNFGANFVNSDRIRSPLALQALTNLRNVVAAGTSTGGSTTGVSP